jgi:hypothetical protein
MNMSTYLPTSLSVSIALSFSNPICLTLSIYHFFPSLSHSLTLSIARSPFLSLPLYFYLSLSTSLSFSISISPSLSIFLPLPFYLSFSASISALYISLPGSLSLSSFFNLLYPSLCLYFYRSINISNFPFSLSPTLSSI